MDRDWERFEHPLIVRPKYAIKGAFGILVNENAYERIISAVAKDETEIASAIEKIDAYKSLKEVKWAR